MRDVFHFGCGSLRSPNTGHEEHEESLPDRQAGTKDTMKASCSSCILRVLRDLYLTSEAS